MIWNWQQPDWPNFAYETSPLEAAEHQFLINTGEFIGAYRYINVEERDLLRIELISDEALTTSAIEGEVLDRESLQSSLRRQFGFGGDDRGVPASERGIAEMMVDLYNTFSAALTHEQLHAWHKMITVDARRIDIFGGYRTHADAMQIVSGHVGKTKVHFEAAPSSKVVDEMDRFVAWFNGSAALPALVRAGIAHLYFESIHPFEDGNGRIGRAIAEKALAQSLGHPSLISLSFTIARDRRRDYDMLEVSSKDLLISDWLSNFGQTVLAAQHNTMRRVSFYIAKAHFFDRFGDRLNERQLKALTRMFSEGIDGFKGGLSAENYISITRTSRATATRDLQDLVDMGALSRTGERRYTRYQLLLPQIC